MSKKYISLEHAIRNAVRDQQYKKPLNEDKEWEKDSAAVKASKDPKFINKMIDKWGERGSAWLNHPLIDGTDKKKPVNEDFEFEMARNELRTAIDAAKRLMTHLDGEGELEAWVQSKITKGADYLDTVADYMDSQDTKKLKEETEEIMEALGIVGGVFKGRQFNNVVPEIGPGHTRSALKASNVRKVEKQEKSLTMHGKVVEEEKLDEVAPIALALPYVTPALGALGAAGAAWLTARGIKNIKGKYDTEKDKTAPKLPKAADTSVSDFSKLDFAPPAEKPVTKPKHDEPVPGTPSQPEKVDVPPHEPYKPDTSPPKEMPKPANDPKPVEPAKPLEKPAEKPAEPVKPVEKPKETPAAPSNPAPAIPKPAAPVAPPVTIPTTPAPAKPAAPAIKPATPVEIPVDAPTAKPAAPAITMPDTKTDVDTKVAPKTAVDSKAASKTEAPAKTEVKNPVAPRKPFSFPFFGLGSSSQASNDVSSGGHTNPWVVHRAADRLRKEETSPDNLRRKDSSKELVGRPDSASVKDAKSVLGRHSSIVHKIDEEKKLAGIVKSVVKKKKEEKESGQNQLVDFEPKLNHKYDNET